MHGDGLTPRYRQYFRLSCTVLSVLLIRQAQHDPRQEDHGLVVVAVGDEPGAEIPSARDGPVILAPDLPLRQGRAGKRRDVIRLGGGVRRGTQGQNGRKPGRDPAREWKGIPIQYPEYPAGSPALAPPRPGLDPSRRIHPCIRARAGVYF